MASWKEKGEVPDSDDDGDFESQSIERDSGDDQPRLEGIREDASNEKDNELDNELDSGEQVYSQNGIENGLERLLRETLADRQASLLDAHEAGTAPTTNPRGSSSYIWSSPHPATVFKAPNFLGGLSDEQIEPTSTNPQTSQPIHELPAEDDISRSYVRITSPVSTTLSSPPEALPELPALARSRNGNLTSTSGSRDIGEAIPEQHAPETNLQDSDDGSSYPMRRALRQRNPIQLHPYVVEQEKYRRTLKSRGIAPMRLASSQVEPQHKPRKSSSPDPDFQEQETQDAEGDTGESQAMDFDWDLLPSSSPVRPAEIHSGGNRILYDEDNDEEDDLPDLEELLRSRHHMSKKKEPKRRRTRSYSHKFKRPILPRILTQPHKSTKAVRNHQPTFDVPASPPATSSPINPPPSGPTGASHRESRSAEPTPSWPGQDEIRRGKALDLPTPATSAIKPPPGSISLESEPESDDPFASDVESSAASASSDESVQIRKISKKFRGVLPASHLRLDQQKNKLPLNRANRDSCSASPAQPKARRGIALPRTQPGTPGNQRSLPATASAGFSFFSDDSDDNDENEISGLIMEDGPASQLESLFAESRMGYAEEEDRIDAMLPSRKRHSVSSNYPPKRRKTGLSSTLGAGTGNHKRQPKITERLSRASKTSSSGKPKSNRPHKESARKISSMRTRPPPPRLGILDVAEIFASSQGKSPDFIRIAVRAARSRAAQGRHDPAGKFFRLSTRDDTEDVQSVLQDWTVGKLQPRHLPNRNEGSGEASRAPFQQIQNNQQTHFALPTSKTQPPVRVTPNNPSRKVRKLLVSSRQQSMNDFIRKEPEPTEPSRPSGPSIRHEPSTKSDSAVQRRPRFAHHSARPAQLEVSEKDYSHCHPSTTFKSSKRALDALYRGTRRRSVPSSNFQLRRFLADEDVLRPSIEAGSSVKRDTLRDTTEKLEKQPFPRKLGRQKRQPHRVDIGAAAYRQPSDPLILNHTVHEYVADAALDGKLLGLAKFGTRYPRHFDILPLPAGVFFHASTFIGSGRLSEIIKDVRVEHHSPTLTVVSLNLAKKFSWGAWDEDVSSEVGLCFDWIAEQLHFNGHPSQMPPGTDVVGVIMSVLDYVQQGPIFIGELTEMMFLSRMLGVLRDFSSRLKVSAIEIESNVRGGVRVLSRICALAFRLLCMVRARQEYAALSLEFEDALRCAALTCAQLLLSQDLSLLRKLFDDLQYLSFRDGGIKSDYYAIEAWVLLIKVLGAANISRGSFWDVVSPILTTVDITSIVDARTMEKIWYSMYTLLPLCEFDEYGAVIEGARHAASFDCWELPQKMLKQIFSLYKSNPRQPPGFNDYFRSIVSRCHYLMVEWGWSRCTAIIGTLFDFFASHNLAHLRNEEVYSSPRFLQELDQNPSLDIEPDDRCFHIFLKIVALALKQLTRANNIKSVRNLIARLLPNHDRQYPKDEAIRQRDLASLRNHHDLLCTLFWASPRSQRPSTTLVEHLVERSHSHKEAFFIHLRARGYLARFLLSEPCDPEAYEPLRSWQNMDWQSLVLQWNGAEEEVRNQTGVGITEAQIKEAVLSNRDQILAQILVLLVTWKNQIDIATSEENAKKALDANLLVETLQFVRSGDKSLTNGLLCQSLKVVEAYINKVRKLYPVSAQQTLDIMREDDDSQESLDDWNMVDTVSAIEPLRGNLHREFAVLVRQCVEQQNEGGDMTLMKYLIETWARMVTLFVEAKIEDAAAYLTFGDYAVFGNRKSYKVANKYWPWFLASFLRNGNDIETLRSSKFYIELQWLLVLTDPCPVKEFEMELTTQMIEKKFPIVVNCQASDIMTTKVQSSIEYMNEFLAQLKARCNGVLSNPKQVSDGFNIMLTAVEDSMKQNLLSMEPGSREHEEYLRNVREIVRHIMAYASDFRSVLPFFSQPSAHYSPDDADPNMVGPILTSYCLRLQRQPNRTSSELLHFLCNSWQRAVVDDRIDAYLGYIKDGMKDWSFIKFMLGDFIPAALQSALVTHSWPLCWHFLLASTGRIKGFLEFKPDESYSEEEIENMKEKAAWVFAKTNDIVVVYTKHLYFVPPVPQANLGVLYDFYYKIDQSLMIYNMGQMEETVARIADFMNTFANLERRKAADLRLLQSLQCGWSDRMEFVEEIVEYMEREWCVADLPGKGHVVRTRNGSGMVELPFGVEDILWSAKSFRESDLAQSFRELLLPPTEY